MDIERGYTETFMVPFKLMGLAIGRDGANIKESRKIKGVRSVRNEKQPDGYRFTVIGESHKAVNEARCLLELKQKAYTVPNHLAGSIIGKHGHEIKEVKDKSLVKNITTDNEKANAVVTFNIIGHTEAIERAVFMLNNKLDAIECINKRIRRQRNESKADKKKLSSKGGGGNSFNGRNNVHRHQKQGKKSPGSKTPPEDCFVFFLKNKIFRRIDYDKKQKQNQRTLQKSSRCNVQMQLQGQRNLNTRELPIDFQLLIAEIVYPDPPVIEKIQREDQHNCSKRKTGKEKVYIIKTDHGPITLTQARFYDSCLGKYIEAAITKKGLNGALKVATWTDCDDDRGTCISLESLEFFNEEGDICFECTKKENRRADRAEQQFSVPQQTKVKATVKNKTIETNHRKTKSCSRYFETAIKNKGSLKFGTSTYCDGDKGTCIRRAFPRISNEIGKN